MSDAAPFGIARAHVIAADGGKEGRDEQIEIIPVGFGSFEAAFDLVDDVRGMPRVAQPEDAPLVGKERGNGRIAPDEMFERVLERGKRIGHEFYFQRKDLRGARARADGVEDIDVDEKIVVGIERDFLPLLPLAVFQGELPVVNIEEFQAVVAVRIGEPIIFPGVRRVIGDTEPRVPILFLKKGDAHCIFSPTFCVIITHWRAQVKRKRRRRQTV